MRRRPLLVAIVPIALLLSSGVAWAQGMDGGSGNSPGGFSTPAAVLLFQLYGLQLQQFAAMPQADQDELAKRAAEYFTNGAEATGVPTSGPGAAYFQNGAQVMAASTADVIPFGTSAFPDAVAEIDASAGVASGPIPDGAAPTVSPVPTAGTTPASNNVGEEAGPAAISPTPSEFSTPPPNPAPAESAAAAESAASSAGGGPPARTTALAGIIATAASAARSSSIANRLVGWIWPIFGAVGGGALLVFLATRLRSRRTPIR